VPHFTIPISPDGPLLDAYVAVSQARLVALQVAKQPIPPAQKIRAIIDTGASCTCIDPSVLQALNLQPTGNILMNTASSGNMPHPTDVYDVGITIPGATAPPLLFATVPVAKTQLLQQHGFHALIGRDILGTCVFHYNGPLQQITVSY